MSKVVVEKATGESESNLLLEEANTLANQVRKRAFEFFLERGQAEGFCLDNWFRAERDLFQVPEADVVEDGRAFHLHIAVPGFNQKDLKVTALPDALLVSAKSKHKHSDRSNTFHLCAFGEKRLFRRFDLPGSIDTHNVHATVEDGLLRVTAFKLDKPTTKDPMKMGMDEQPFFEDS